MKLKKLLSIILTLCVTTTMNLCLTPIDAGAEDAPALSTDNMTLYNFNLNSDCDYYDWDDASTTKALSDGVVTITANNSKLKFKPYVTKHIEMGEDWYYLTYTFKTNQTSLGFEKFGQVYSTNVENDNKKLVSGYLRDANKYVGYDTGLVQFYPGDDSKWTGGSANLIGLNNQWVKNEFYFDFTGDKVKIYWLLNDEYRAVCETRKDADYIGDVIFMTNGNTNVELSIKDVTCGYGTVDIAQPTPTPEPTPEPTIEPTQTPVASPTPVPQTPKWVIDRNLMDGGNVNLSDEGSGYYNPSTGTGSGSYNWYVETPDKSTKTYDESTGILTIKTSDSKFKFMPYVKPLVEANKKWYYFSYKMKTNTCPTTTDVEPFGAVLEGHEGTGQIVASSLRQHNYAGGTYDGLHQTFTSDYVSFGMDTNIYTTMDKWYTIEYYFDMSVDGQTTIYRIVNDEDKGVCVTKKNPHTIGNFLWSTNKGATTTEFMLSDIRYGYGDEEPIMHKVVPTPTPNPDATPTPIPEPTPTPIPGVNSYTINFNSNDVESWGDNNPNSVHGYDADEDAGYFQTNNSNIQYKVLGHKRVPDGYNWYRLKYSLKVEGDMNLDRLLCLHESKDEGGYDGGVSIIKIQDETGYAFYGDSYTTKYQKLSQTFKEWTDLDFYFDMRGDMPHVYLYIDGVRTVEYVANKAFTKIGMFYIGTKKGSTTKGYIKDCTYYWGSKMSLPDADSEYSATAAYFMDDFDIEVDTLTVGKAYTACYDSSELTNGAKLAFYKDGESTPSEVIPFEDETLNITPSEKGHYDFITSEEGEDVVVKTIKTGLPLIDSDLFKNKGQLTVSYIGGSITEGAGATYPANRWTSQLTKYLNNLGIEGTTFREANAGIGGTCSHYGVLRLNRDVLAYKPDIVFVEYNVNDTELTEELSTRCYEGILRKFMESDKVPYVIGIGTCTNDGKIERDERAALHKRIANSYGLSFIDINKYMTKQYGAASSTNTERNKLYTTDNVHPANAGYAYYAKVIENLLNDASFSKPSSKRVINPNYIRTSGVFINAYDMQQSGNWSSEGKGDWNEANQGYGGSRLDSNDANSSLTFNFKGSVLFVGNNIHKINGDMVVDIDGVKSTVSTKWDTESYQPVTWFSTLDLSEGEHTVTISPKGNGYIEIDFIIVSDDNEPGPIHREDKLNSYEIDLKSGTMSADIGYYDWGTGLADYDWDETEQALYFKTNSSKFQLKLNGQNHVPNGYNWYRLKYSVKNPDRKLLHIAGQLVESSAKDAYYNRLFTVQGAISELQANSNGDSFRLDGDFSDWTDFDIYFNNTNRVSPEIYVFANGKYYGHQTLATTFSRLGMLFFATPELETTGTMWVRDVVYYWCNEPINMNVGSLKVESTSIDETKDSVAFNDKKSATISVNFNYPFVFDGKLDSIVSVKNASDYTVSQSQDQKSIIININKLNYETDYEVSIVNKLDIASSVTSDEYPFLIGLQNAYKLPFTTFAAPFAIEDITFNGKTDGHLVDFAGENVTLGATLKNTRDAAHTGAYVVFAICHSDGRLYKLVQTEPVDVQTASSATVSAKVDIPSTENYILEVYTVEGDNTITPLCKKQVIK